MVRRGVLVGRLFCLASWLVSCSRRSKEGWACLWLSENASHSSTTSLGVRSNRFAIRTPWMRTITEGGGKKGYIYWWYLDLSRADWSHERAARRLTHLFVASSWRSEKKMGYAEHAQAQRRVWFVLCLAMLAHSRSAKVVDRPRSWKGTDLGLPNPPRFKEPEGSCQRTLSSPLYIVHSRMRLSLY